MGQKICVTKKFTYVSFFLILAILFVVLGQITLQSKQATNSRASGSQKTSQIQVFQAPEPNCANKQLNCYTLSLTRDRLGKVQFTTKNSSSIIFKEDGYYSVYLDSPRTHIVTFKGKTKDAYELFSKWRKISGVNKNNINQTKFTLFTVPSTLPMIPQ